MGRQPMEPGTHGRISVAANPMASGSAVIHDAFYAQARYADPETGKVRQLRRFGPTERKAVERLQEALREHLGPPVADTRFSTLGEAVAAFYAGPVPASWSAGTARSMGYARRLFDEHAAERWPVSAARADTLFPATRTGELARRLLRQVATSSRCAAD